MGTIKCWGENYFGQVGDGTTADISTPVSVTGITTATQISAGTWHTCTVLSDCSIKCWGQNQFGQLGDRTTSNSLIPTSVDGITAAATISAGGNHTCTRLSSGSVKCWGLNSDGQLGNGSMSNSSTPVIVSGTSTPTVSVPENTSLPEVIGTTRVGLVLATSNGGWSGSPDSYSYQWQHCNAEGQDCTNILDATNSTYTLVIGDLGFALRARVTATNSAGTASISSDQTSVVAEAALTNTAAPVISGDVAIGQDVSASTGEWYSPAPIDYYTYQWERCDVAGENCEDITDWGSGYGPFESSYTIQMADIGHTLHVRVQASYMPEEGPPPVSANAISNPTDVVADPTPVNTSLPVISGDAVIGETLTVSNGEWSSPLPIDYYAYQWQLCDAAGENCEDTDGWDTHTVWPYELGHTFRVRVYVGYFSIPFGASALSDPSNVVTES